MLERIFDITTHIKEQYPEMPNIFSAKENGKWRNYSIDEYIEKSETCALALIKLGLKPGDKVLTITTNRPEWNFVDVGISSAGLIHVPVYPNISASDYEYIFNHSQAKIVICESLPLYKKIRPIIDNINTVQDIYTFDKIPNVKHWNDLLKVGETARQEGLISELEKRKNAIKTNDLASIIYTSGTTSRPKGVMLSHRNFMWQAPIIASMIPLQKGNAAISFLPLCHVLERIGNYSFQYLCLSISYVESISKISQNMKEVKPYIFVTVPRLLERIYDKIISNGKSLSLPLKMLFFSAVNHGLKYDNKESSFWYRLKLKVYRKLIFSKWKKALGGNLRFVIAGGAAMQPRLPRVFHAAEIEIYEGYGLTESSPVISVNRPGELRFTTTGPALSPEEQHIKIAEDGEILFKGPNLMMGYYQDEELTREALDEDGFFHTGDIGEFVDGRFLRITDRKKEIFKLSTGKYVAPQVVENVLKESLFVEQVAVVGESEKYTAALVLPNFKFLHGWASIKKVYFRDNKDLVSNPKVVARYAKEIEKYNERLQYTEQIKKFVLLPVEWTSETGELSPTLKLKRRFIYKKYSKEIASLYPDETNY